MYRIWRRRRVGGKVEERGVGVGNPKKRKEFVEKKENGQSVEEYGVMFFFFFSPFFFCFYSVLFVHSSFLLFFHSCLRFVFYLLAVDTLLCSSVSLLLLLNLVLIPSIYFTQLLSFLACFPHTALPSPPLLPPPPPPPPPPTRGGWEGGREGSIQIHAFTHRSHFVSLATTTTTTTINSSSSSNSSSSYFFLLLFIFLYLPIYPIIPRHFPN